MQEELGFEDFKDFEHKVESSLNFKIMVQKLVFLAEYFGWNNSYSYDLYIHGPYSSNLADDYYSNNLFNYSSLKIQDFDSKSMKQFIKDKSLDYLESASTILFYKKLNENISLDFAIKKLAEIKPHISSKIVEESYHDVEGFKLTNKSLNNIIQVNALNDFKNNLKGKIIKNIRLFENFEINYNRIFILGSLDYLRIVLREEELNNFMKNDLFNLISKYLADVENIYSHCNEDNDVFNNMNLKNLEEFFDRIQNYISRDLNVLPRLDGDDFDESLFYN